MIEFKKAKIDELVINGLGFLAKYNDSGDDIDDITDQMGISLAKNITSDNGNIKKEFTVLNSENEKIVLLTHTGSVMDNELLLVKDIENSMGKKDRDTIIKVTQDLDGGIVFYVYYDRFNYFNIKVVGAKDNRPAEITIFDGVMSLTQKSSGASYKVYDNVEEISANDCNMRNYLNIIIRYMREYVNGLCWSSMAEKGIMSISFALGYCIQEILEDWKKGMDASDSIGGSKQN